MSPRTSSPQADAQPQQVSISVLIQVLGIVIPALVTVAGSLIVLSQRRMEIQIPISTTQTVEAKQTFVAASAVSVQTSVPNPTGEAVTSGVDNVEVILNNSEATSPSVHLIIKKDDIVITDLILPPGGTAPKINLPPGNYEVEARPIYPLITPTSPNCQIQWQLGELYKRDLVITSGKAVIQIKQFDFEPREICSTATPVP
jgi:hypothetical protein